MPSNKLSVVPAQFADILYAEFSKNTLSEYLGALIAAVLGIGVLLAINKFIGKKLQQWSEKADLKQGKLDRDLTREVVSSFMLLQFLMPAYMALNSLTFSPGLTKFIYFVFLILFTWRTVRFLANLASLLTDLYLRGNKHGGDQTVGKAVMPIVRTIIWALGLTILLDNMGFQVSSIIAGLGIVGVAVGLAGQAILADFFSYLAILIDRPFSIGDAVAWDNISGTVESIGMKTTRIRSISGEMIVCPNGDLTKKYLSNYARLRERSRTFRFGVAYETPVAQVKAIPAMVDEAVSSANASMTRAHFINFGESSLDFEVVFKARVKDLAALLAVQEKIFLSLMERFEREGITFAYPTRTLYVNK